MTIDKVSLIKAFTWRFIATLSIIVIAFLFTGDTSTALKIGALEFVWKILLYYLHELTWIKIIKKYFSSDDYR